MRFVIVVPELAVSSALETMALDASGRVAHLGGFYLGEPESDIPPDSLFPVRTFG